MDFRKYLPDRKAFTALLVGSIMAIMIGAILLIISYVVINSILQIIAPAGTMYTVGTNVTSALATGTQLNLSLTQTLNNIAQALNIAGIGLIVAGVAGIIYMLIGLGGTTGRGR